MAAFYGLARRPLQKSKVLASIRNFFASRDVVEVETPLLCHGTITDIHLDAIKAKYLSWHENGEETLYLQTSPEFAMKRLTSFWLSIYLSTSAKRLEMNHREGFITLSLPCLSGTASNFQYMT